MVAGKDVEWHACRADETWQEQAAPQEAVSYILSQPENTGDGRSHWVWIRLPDGDLVLATYPQGDTYFSTEHWRKV